MVFPGFNRTSASDLASRNFFNANWDLADLAFTSLKSAAGTTPSGVPNPTIGTEWINGSGDLRVFNGSSWVSPETQETWGSWQTMTIQSPFSVGITPCQIRVSNYKNVEIAGTVQISGTPWPSAPDYVLVHSGQFGVGYLPEMTSVFPIAPNIQASGFASAEAYLTVGGSPSTLSIYVCYEGPKASGNSVRLDGIKYKAV